jgi:tetratricopeptide (TPR) repeat protein
VVYGAAVPFLKDWLTAESTLDIAGDPFLEGPTNPILLILPNVDFGNPTLLRKLGHRIQEAFDRGLPRALIVLDDSPPLTVDDPGAGQGEGFPLSRGMAALRHYIQEVRRVDVLRVPPLSDSQCREAFAGLGLSAQWGHVLYQLSEGRLNELCILWEALQRGDFIAPVSGRWQALQPGTAEVGRKLTRDRLAQYVERRVPTDSVHHGRVLDALYLAASMGTMFLPEAVAEAIVETDPKRGEFDSEEWASLWRNVLVAGDADQAAFAVQSMEGDVPQMLKADARQFVLYTFHDPGLVSLLRAGACQMWREHGTDNAHSLFVKRTQALERWIERHFRDTWRQALGFRATLLRMQNRISEGERLDDLEYRLRLRESLRVQVEEERRKASTLREHAEFYALLLHLATTLAELGDCEAEADVLREALDLATTKEVARSKSESITLQRRLGAAMVDLGAYAEAEPLLTQGLDLALQHLGPEHPVTFDAQDALATLYTHQGRYAQAEPLYVRSMWGRMGVLGKHNSATLSSFNNLANLYRRQGKREPEAEHLLLDALEGRERLVGPDHPATLNILDNLADLYQTQGRFAEAQALCLRAVAGRERLLGPEHPRTLTSYHLLANFYRRTGQYADAEPLFERILQLHERVLGPEHPSTLEVVANFAPLYEQQGLYSEAETLLERALEGRAQALGISHPDTLDSAAKLGNLLSLQARFTEAERLYSAVLAARTQTLGAEDLDTLRAADSYGNVCAQLGRFQEAESWLRQAMKGRERVLGPDHPLTLDTAHTLAFMFLSLQRYGEAEPLYVRVVEALGRATDPSEWDRINAENSLTDLYMATGRLAAIESFLVDVMERRERAFGPLHPATLHCALKLVAVYWNLRSKNDEEVEPFLRMVLECYEEAMGREDPVTILLRHLQQMLAEDGFDRASHPISFTQTVPARAP